MFKSRFVFASALIFACAVAKADSTQKIDVLNDGAQVMNLAARTADNSFNVKLRIPAYAKAFVIAKITKLNSLQDQLFMGIFRNSAVEVAQAIAAGANVNALREGRTPLAWALSFGMVDAAACLLQHGAR